MKKYYGYIEGYYGKMLTWPERNALIDCLKILGLNTYVYAPKEDSRHRLDWRRPYESGWRRQFQALVQRAKSKGVAVVGALAPGLSFDYMNAADYRALFKKAEAFLKWGASGFALLMDDIEESLPKNCQSRFYSLAQAHGSLLARLKTDLESRFPGRPLWFCPTVYTDAFIAGKTSQSAYLKDLAEAKPPDVPVFWTGPDVVAPKINTAVLNPLFKLFGQNILVWDNYYANDYCPERLFLGPYLNRDRRLPDKVGGWFLNPTGLIETDFFYLALLAGYLRGKAPTAAWKEAAGHFELPEDFFRVAGLVHSPFDSLAFNTTGKSVIRQWQQALQRLLFQWKGPLQREWYPVMHSLKRDLDTAAKGSLAPPDGKLATKYTVVMAHMLKKAGRLKKSKKTPHVTPLP